MLGGELLRREIAQGGVGTVPIVRNAPAPILLRASSSERKTCSLNTLRVSVH